MRVNNSDNGVSVVREEVEVSQRIVPSGVPNEEVSHTSHVLMLGRGARKVFMRSLSQFTPIQYERYDWKVFSSPKRFFWINVLVISVIVVELNGFFLKYALWIPPPHPLVIGRLLICWLLWLPGLREFYQFISDKTVNKFGTMYWLGMLVIGVELLVEIKFCRGLFPAPWPRDVVWGWTIGLTLYLTGVFVYFYRKYKRGEIDRVEGKIIEWPSPFRSETFEPVAKEDEWKEWKVE